MFIIGNGGQCERSFPALANSSALSFPKILK
jgi:hypothetical protein